jgi:sortase A
MRASLARRSPAGTVAAVATDGGAGDPRPADADQSEPGDAALRNLEQLEASRPRRRLSRWDRPPPPHDWRWLVSGIGKVLIVTGLLMFAFVAYQLWGTGIEYSQAQSRLDDQFEELLATTSTTMPPAPTTTVTNRPPPPTTNRPPPTTNRPPPTSTTTTVPVWLPAFEEGEAIARIEIPSIGVDAKVVAGVDPDDLKKGPGHYPGTPMPGQFGNSAIAGHRTTYGQPFYRLDEVQVGDEIVLTTVQGRFVYRATGSEVVDPGASQVVATTDPTTATLTLTTCTPRYTASQRLVVHGALDLDASDPPQPAVLDYRGGTEEEPTTTATTATTATATSRPRRGSATSVPSTTDGPPATTTEDPTIGAGGGPSPGVSDESADAFSHGWFSDSRAWPHVALWGLLCAAVTIGSYLLARSIRRMWVGVLAAFVPFVIALYFFFQNVNRLLPAAI